MEVINNKTLKLVFTDIDDDDEDYTGYHAQIQAGAKKAYKSLSQFSQCSHCGNKGYAMSAYIPDDEKTQKKIGGKEGFLRVIFYSVCAECIFSPTVVAALEAKVISTMARELLH